MKKLTKNKKYTPVSNFAFLVLGLLLVSFSPIDSQSRKSAGPLLTPNVLLTKEAVIGANPIKDKTWDLFQPVWNRAALWPGLINRLSKTSAGIDPLETSFSDLDYLLDDPFNRLEPEFKIPPELRERVSFWLQVFGRIPSRTKIVHDKRKPEVIYGYLDFRDLFRETSSLATASYRTNRSEQTALKSLANRMREAAGLTKTHLLSEDERAELRGLIEKAVGGLDEQSVSKAIRNLRTQTGQNDFFLDGLRRAQVLLPQIELIFKQRGLPIGLTRIPFVESSFNPKAYSKIGAIGLWQFVRETARQMIHQESEAEWRNPIAQSKAAARMLKLYKSVLPDWGITITAYNSGVGRMRRLTQKYDVESVADFDSIPIKEDFGFAGRNFFAEVLAVNLLEHYKDILFPEAVPAMEPFLVFKGVNLPE
jgi:membrane-bound lytic murein transglycosylase D